MLLGLLVVVSPAYAQEAAWAGALAAAFPTAAADAPGCAVAVIQRGRVIARYAFGLADIEHRIALTTASPIHVASLSKQFTAAAVLLLQDRRKIALDQPIRTFVPQLAPAFGSVSIAQLMHHTSGLRDQWSLMSAAGWRYSLDFMDEADVVDLLLRQAELNFPPGTRHLYSNSGYTMLAQIVERVSGSRFGDFLSASLFTPLRMLQTHVMRGSGELVYRRAEGYRYASGRFLRAATVSDASGAAAIMTTVDDLALWEAELQTLKVLPKAVRLIIRCTGDTAGRDAGTLRRRRDPGTATGASRRVA